MLFDKIQLIVVDEHTTDGRPDEHTHSDQTYALHATLCGVESGRRRVPEQTPVVLQYELDNLSL